MDRAVGGGKGDNSPVRVVGANMSTASSEKMEVVMSSKLVHLPPSTLNHHSAQHTEQALWFRFPSHVSLRAVNRCSFSNLTYTHTQHHTYHLI